MSDQLIDARLTIIEHKIDQLLALLRGGASPVPGAASEPNVASDADLDGQYGNPEIRKDPPTRYWHSGESFVGARFSDTTPEYLDAVAKYLDAYAWAAGKNASEGNDVEKNEKNARFKALDAARARGWAARLRARGVARSADAALAAIPDPADDCPF